MVAGSGIGRMGAGSEIRPFRVTERSAFERGAPKCLINARFAEI